MTIDYAAPLKKAFSFCLEPKRWLPFFIIDLAFLSVGFSLIMSNSMFFLYILAGVQDIGLYGDMALFFLEIFGLFIAWVLVSIWLNGAVIHQSYKEKEFAKSWTVSRKKYLSLLGVTAVTALLALVAGIIPYVGWLISLLVGIALFFGLQGVIVRGHGFMKALEDSWHIFKRQPFKVFLMWILISVLTLVILAIFALPLLALIFRMIISLAGTTEVTAETILNLIYVLENQLPLLVVSGIIFVLGMAISRAFSIKAQTEFYLQIKKK